jgi:hypothetical protein
VLIAHLNRTVAAQNTSTTSESTDLVQRRSLPVDDPLRVVTHLMNTFDECLDQVTLMSLKLNSLLSSLFAVNGSANGELLLELVEVSMNEQILKRLPFAIELELELVYAVLVEMPLALSDPVENRLELIGQLSPTKKRASRQLITVFNLSNEENVSRVHNIELDTNGEHRNGHVVPVGYLTAAFVAYLFSMLVVPLGDCPRALNINPFRVQHTVDVGHRRQPDRLHDTQMRQIVRWMCPLAMCSEPNIVNRWFTF